MTNREAAGHFWVDYDYLYLCLVSGFVGNGQFFPAFLPSARDDVASAGRRHPFPEAVLILSFPVGWLKCSFHDDVF